MRKDMGKVITERPRGGSRSRNKKYGESIRWDGHDGNYDNQPKRVTSSARGQYGYDAREFTDVLGPVKGFIRKNVGRPWNKVYSEVCKVLDKRKVTHKHVIDHMFQWVETSPIFCPDGYWRSPDNIYSRLNDDGQLEYYGMEPEFIVHPKTGLLVANKPRESKGARIARWREREKQNQKDTVKIDESSCYRKINDIWYRCKIREADKHEVELYKAIHTAMHTDHQSRVMTYGAKKYYIEDKKQLGKKELKALRERLK